MKIRVRYSKFGKVRFTSHRDAARIWERALRKAGVPVVMSSGFSPRPKLSFGLALPTGAESYGEYLDIDVDTGVSSGISTVWDAETLTDPEGLDRLADHLSGVLPLGFHVESVVLITSGPSLQEDVTSCRWEIHLHEVDRDAVDAGVRSVLAASEVLLERERKGTRRTDDVRPAVLELSCRPSDDPVVVDAVLATQGRALRPHELVSALLPGTDPLEVVARVIRTHQWIERDGERREVLPAARDASPDTADARKDPSHERPSELATS